MGDNRAASRGRGEHRNGVTEGADVEPVYFVMPRRYKYNSLLIIIVLKGSVFMEPTAKSAAVKDKKTPVSEMMKNAVKGTLISMIFSVAAILLFALIIKETGLADNVISVINQVIKIGGIMAASYFAVKSMADRQWICGGITGFMYILLSYLVYSLIEGMFGNAGLLFSNLLMGLLIGAVFAIITANFLSGTGKAKPGRGIRRRRIAAAK